MPELTPDEMALLQEVRGILATMPYEFRSTSAAQVLVTASEVPPRHAKALLMTVGPHALAKRMDEVTAALRETVHAEAAERVAAFSALLRAWHEASGGSP